MISRIVEI